jgi:hypothetical protein
MTDRQSRGEKRCKAELQALSSALRDALSDLVEVHGIQYLDVFLERRLNDTVEELRRGIGVAVPSILAAQRSAADDAEDALRREVDTVRRAPRSTSRGTRGQVGSSR